MRTQGWHTLTALISMMSNSGAEAPGAHHCSEHIHWHRRLAPGDTFSGGTLTASVTLGSWARGWGTGHRGGGREVCILDKQGRERTG